jgi:hypothetical protein
MKVKKKKNIMYFYIRQYKTGNIIPPFWLSLQHGCNDI